VSDVRFENIQVEDSNDRLVDLVVFVSQYSVDRSLGSREQYRFDKRWDGVLVLGPEQRAEHASSRGHIRAIVFKDIRVVAGPRPHSILYGWDAEHAVENITFDGLWIHGKKISSAERGKFALENTRNVMFK